MLDPDPVKILADPKHWFQNLFFRKLGVPEEWEINDVFGLDDELLLMLPQPVLALLLLFPINDKHLEFAKVGLAKQVTF